MKQFILFAHLFTFLSLADAIPLSAQDSLRDYPNYVVIGAFAIHNNAINFAGDANKNHFSARFEINPNRNLYYVYVLATDDREHAIAEALRLRKDTKYFDTWVYSGALGTNALAVGTRPGVDVNPVTGQEIQRITASATDESGGVIDDANRVITQAPRPTRRPSTNVNRTAGTVDAHADSTVGAKSIRTPPASTLADRRAVLSTDTGRARSPGVPPVRVSTAPLSAGEVSGKNFYFHLSRADNQAMVDGEVDAIDFERSRRMATYKANSPVIVKMPSSKTKQMSFICQVFGYRKQQIEFDPNSPSQDFYLDDRGNLVVPFELVRLQKGDIAIMYNVFFFKDAAVMRPESRYEVSNLLDLLVENPAYRIRIHGHTNGNASGKIIRMDTPGNFYSLSGTKQGFGSAKELSEERAIVIRDFLASSGISSDRMEVKAWGGKKPIHDKHSVRANENVRVEIEILSD